MSTLIQHRIEYIKNSTDRFRFDTEYLNSLTIGNGMPLWRGINQYAFIQFVGQVSFVMSNYPDKDVYARYIELFSGGIPDLPLPAVVFDKASSVEFEHVIKPCCGGGTIR